MFPVPRQFYEYEIRGRSVGRTAAAAHAARFAQSSQARPPYRLCIRPPASSVSLPRDDAGRVKLDMYDARKYTYTHARVPARATRKGRPTREKSQAAPLPPS